MLKDKGMDRYKSTFKPEIGDKRPIGFMIFYQRRVYLNQASGSYTLPMAADIKNLNIPLEDFLYYGEYMGIPCYCIERDCEDAIPGFTAITVRVLPALTGNEDMFQTMGNAMHLAHWNRMNRFCGCCGGRMEDKSDERAKLCPRCGAVVYPRISPATITAILRDNEILLAHNKHFKPGLYSLIAGFAEPGESLEDCVRREVFEETGIQIKNIRYFGSQPWPFPDALMVGFLAEYESGEVCADGIELTDARFWKLDELPLVPTRESIAGKIIAHLVREYEAGKESNLIHRKAKESEEMI